MKYKYLPVALMMLVLVSGCDNAPPVANNPPVTDDPPVDLVISQTWSGDYPVAELRRLPGSQQESGAGYLGTPAEFEAVWSLFKPAEPVPVVDFGEHIVVFHRNVDFYNQTRIFKVSLEDGVLEVLAMETMSALPIEDKVSMALAVVPREGVKFIQAGPTRIPVLAE